MILTKSSQIALKNIVMAAALAQPWLCRWLYPCPAGHIGKGQCLL